MTPIVVRRVTSADAVAVAELRHAAIRNEPRAFAMSMTQLEHPSHDAWRQLCERYSTGSHSLFVADTGDEIVGMVGCRSDESAKMHHCGMIWGMYVAPLHRSNGLAHMLLDAVIAHGVTQQWRMLKLSVTVHQHAAIRLYQRCGFTVYAHEPALLYIDNEEIDALHMVYRYHVGGTQQ